MAAQQNREGTEMKLFASGHAQIQGKADWNLVPVGKLSSCAAFVKDAFGKNTGHHRVTVRDGCVNLGSNSRQKHLIIVCKLQKANESHELVDLLTLKSIIEALQNSTFCWDTAQSSWKA